MDALRYRTGARHHNESRQELEADKCVRRTTNVGIVETGSSSCGDTNRPRSVPVHFLIVGANIGFNQDSPVGRDPPLPGIGFLLAGAPGHHLGRGRLREPARLRRDRRGRSCRVICVRVTVCRAWCRSLRSGCIS